MRRQITPEELDALYRHVGRCIWHMQYLEDVLHTLLTMKVEIREPGRLTEQEARSMLAKHRRASLGTALGTAEKHDALPSTLLTELRSLKEERDWLVHRSMNQDGEALYTDRGRGQVVSRLEVLMERTLHLRALLLAETEAFCAGHGVSTVQADLLAREQIAALKGNA